MRRGEPASFGFVPREVGAPNDLGVTTFALAEELELWRLNKPTTTGATLLGYGRRRLGGFVDGGHDEAGVWLVRTTAPLSLAMKAERGAWSFERVIHILVDLADALACAEERAIFPGPLLPDRVFLRERGAHFGASSLIRHELGVAPHEDEVPPIYCPPAQADGQPWDHAANRYLLGHLGYRLLSGGHPYAGGGLRRALEAARRERPPPFEEAIREALPPGLQSLLLSLLDPDPTQRPKNASELFDVLSGFVPRVGQAAALVRPVRTGSRRRTGSGPLPSATAPSEESNALALVSRKRPVAPPEAAQDGGAQPARPARKPNRLSSQLLAAAPIAIGAAVALFAFSTIEPQAPVARVDSPPIAALEPLSGTQTEAETCAGCHPRHAAEWKRSIMGHAIKSPLFGALESLIQEQVGRDFDCPNGAGILRKTTAELACRNPRTGIAVSGSGGEHWCVNCHAPQEIIDQRMPAWQGKRGGDLRANAPVRDLLGPRGVEGIGCGSCHQVHGPVRPNRGGYQGNPSWTSTDTGITFPSRPEDRQGLFGIANSGYDLQPSSFFLPRGKEPLGSMPHRRPTAETKAYLASSEFCGSCHDVRLFGTDAIHGARGENFKRLRNGYTEWTLWAADEKRAGREPATCQGCHMSTFPGVCVPSPGAPGDDTCPSGTRFEARKPGEISSGFMSTASREPTRVTPHYFSGVDLPLSPEFPPELLDEAAIDTFGLPISSKARRDLLLKAAFRFDVEEPRISRGQLTIPLVIENIGSGHRVPAGFSQEREFWVHLRVLDADKRVVYEVGRVDRADQDLADKVFERVNTNPNLLDRQGRPVGLFGADVRDGLDVPRWSPPPELGGSTFRGRGLINFQNGFLRCVTCIGEVAADGSCQPGPGQGRLRADRFADGNYDQDSGRCDSNLSGSQALFETYFPVGALDSTRGLPKAADAIIDTRSAPPNVPLRYTYEIDARRARLPLRIEARLMFRAFPPFLIRAFADYERQMAALGRRPSGPQIDLEALQRLELVLLAKRKASVGE